MRFERKQLNNGLKIIAHTDFSTSIVALNILYNVGARDEDENRTGFAHLFEHLMFGGSVNIPDFDGTLQKAGGENNAFTNNDITNYYITVPPENAETAFYLESDRMLQLAFSQAGLDVQKSVVAEEFKQSYLNQPYGDVSLFLRPLSYKKHPYKWSTIGKNIDHILNAKLSDVKDFFYKYYAPNNAILVVGGNITCERVFYLAEKWFGDIPARTIPKRNLPTEPKQSKKRILTLERNVPANAIYMAYHMCGRTDDDYYATDLISDLLANGKSSRFNTNLVKKKGIFSEADAYIQGTHHPGLLIISAKLHKGIDFNTAEAEIKKELNNISKGNFSDYELEKVKNKVLATQKISQTDILNKTMELAFCEWLENAEMLNEIENKYREVSREDIIRIAEKILVDSNLSCINYKSTEI